MGARCEGRGSWLSDSAGCVSVTSALTEAPSLSTFSPFSVKGLGGGVAAGLDPGGDDSWTSSGDRHAIGESKCFPLLKVVKDTSKFCLGCIGLDSRQFCWSTACRVVLHRPKRCTFCHVRRGISSVPQGKG